MSVLDATMSGEWVFDPSHTRVGFSARHAMVTKVRGAFNEVDGRMLVDPDGPAKSSVEVRLAVASIDTRNGQRDDHLRSPDFFDVETHPEIVFQSTSVDEIEDDTYMVVGDLTIRDITKQVAIPITLMGVERDPMGNLRAGFEGTRRVDRRDFGLEWNVPLDTGGVLVSEKITLEFEISAVKSEAAPAEAGVADEGAGLATAGDGPADAVNPELTDAQVPVDAPDAPDNQQAQPVGAQQPSPWEPPPGHRY
ncbi:polyisoprenoid-binding protein [Occultella glacieicola]|uniref:Polyisoprenoid-binding protein n=1 Tax=Occultella glacieicola TaxID=2518684 RepID=A0ABY2E4E4_9MICO|nr:YceI family protein [Occultella glacieicola]TDE94892.1 polyisoprenoid-binding protein [Occultella glacieicola]